MDVTLDRWTTTFLVLFATVLLNGGQVAGIGFGVVGHRQACDNEGEPVDLYNIDKLKCYICICRNGFVECQKNPSCPEVKGCHMLEHTDEHCCPKCRGCFYEGSHFESGDEWTDKKAPCATFKCEAGVLTKSTMHCHVPCDNPLDPLPGKCCPTCPDCRINGHLATSDRDVTPGDLCVKCRCLDGNRLTCTKKVCPVLHCQRHEQVQRAGECCPTCRGTREILNAPHTCMLGKSVYYEGRSMDADQCTRCTCVNQTNVCERENCPGQQDFRGAKVARSSTCCKDTIKSDIMEVKMQCRLNNREYEEGQSWSLDSCTKCKCLNGRISCEKTPCPDLVTCPFGSHLLHEDGECCKKCVENKSEATCVVFGDPHYRTFDGKMYTFQAIGKYQFVSDCANHTFSVRVTNDFSNRNKSSTATKRVRIKFGDLRVNLGQRCRVRVDGERTTPPFKSTRVTVTKQDHDILVKLGNNVKILWNCQSYLEVTVPIGFKNRLCGLCGNFNSNVQDDLRSRKKGLLSDEEVQKFGFSWCVGKECTKYLKKSSMIRACKLRAHKNRHVENPCKYLTSNEVFNGCYAKLNYNRYHYACLQDMCDCPSGKCYCDSLMAYAQECKRLGVDVNGWQKHSYCTTNNVNPTVISANGSSKLISGRRKPFNRNPLQGYTKQDIARFTQELERKPQKGSKPMIQ